MNTGPPTLALLLGCTLLAAAAPATLRAQRAAVPAPSGRGAPVAARPASDTGLVMGTYVSSLIDNKRLPVRDLATDDQGTQYLIEFNELVLSIKPNGEFRAGLRYRQTLAAKGQRVNSEPLQKMTVYGSWSRDRANNIRFVPDPKRGGEGLRILAGTTAGKTITVPFDYQNGRVNRRANVVLIYDPKIF